MIDYQRIAEDIRAAVACNDSDARTLLAESAADFSVAVEEVNTRLRQCATLLKRGLRSEALQLCEREPNLLDVVGTLDIPELFEWQAKLSHFELVVPPAINLDVAAELNEAYAIEQPLAETLRIHRLQALGRVPLALRINTIRKLAELDAENPIWQDDQRSYERARLQQISGEADLAVKQANLASLQDLVSEISDGGWLETIPSTVRTGVLQAEAKLRRQNARHELERLEPLLNAAFAEYDEEQGLKLQKEWNLFRSEAGLKDESPLLQRMLPALDWLTRVVQQRQAEQTAAAAQAALDHALDANADLVELERLHHSAVRWQPLPQVLEQRYQTRIQGLELQQTRRRRMVIAAASVAVLIAAGMAALGIQARNLRAEVERHVATLERLLDVDHLAEAEKYIGDLRASAPRVAGSANISALALELDNLKASEQSRLKQFQQLLQVATTAGVEQPDTSSLEQARGLARTDEEKLAVLEFDGQVRSAQRRLQQERDQQFSARLSTLTAKVKEVESATDKQPDTVLAKLDPIEAELKALLDSSGNVTTPLLRTGQALQSRIDQMQIEHLRTKRELAKLPSITASVGDLDAYQLALEKYSDDFPDTKRSAEFRKFVADGLPHYRVVLEWSEFARAWNAAHSGPLTPESAKELLSQAQQLKASHAIYPWKGEFDRRIPYLEAVIAQADVSAITDLKRLLADRLISNMWMIQAGEDRYYLPVHLRPIENQPNLFPVSYVAAFDGSKKDKMFKKADFGDGGPNWYGPAPQSVVAKRALDELTKLGQEPWELIFLSICSAIQTQERIEPIVQLILLEQVLSVGMRGSRILTTLCERPMSLLKTSPVDLTAVWLNPENTDVKPQRSLAEDVMKRIPDFSAMVPDTKKQLQDLSQLPLTEIVFVGWMAHADSGWICLPGTSTKATGPLYVLSQTVPGGPVQMTRVGSISSTGETSVASGLAQSEGQLVFATRSAASRATPE